VKNKLPASLKGKVLITTAVGLITILVIYLAIDRAFEKLPPILISWLSPMSDF
jgi:hypothetical protein